MAITKLDKREGVGFEIQWYDHGGNNASVWKVDTIEELAQCLARACWSCIAFNQNPSIWKDGKKWCFGELTPADAPEGDETGRFSNE